MMTISDFVHEHEFIGLEYDWIAIDEEGHIGYFSTAGAGPVPKLCILRPTLFDGLFEKTIAMTSVCEVTQIAVDDRDISDWISIAKKGIFAFDWRRESASYQLVAKPENPIKVDSLSGDIRDLVSQMELEYDFDQGVGLVGLMAIK